MSASGSAFLPRSGDIIDGKYALERLLGQGGMGAVYAARHIKLGHAVAIKVMLADAGNHEAAQRFINEGRAAANIQNEHVVRVFDVDEENGYAYMVLELLEGEDLAQILDREIRLAPHVAVGYVLQGLEGVRQAHAQGIVHRDLKPSNLFLARRQDGSVVVKVLDFGISKANSSSPLGQTPGQLTSTKAMLGSPLYMSPEQLRSSKSVDARADIWAMGIILYELMTGELPFMGENLGALFAAILETEAPPLRQRIPTVPQPLEAIVQRCLQRRPEHRYQTAAELERDLQPFTNPALMSAAQLQPHAPATVAMAPPAAGYPMAGAPAVGYATELRASAVTGGPVVAQAVTGGASASGPHAVKGTVPLGANTPQHLQHQTGNTWQNTGSQTKKGSSVGVIVLVGLVVLAVAGGVLGVFALKNRHASDGPVAGSAALSVSAVPKASDAPPVVATGEPSGAPASSVALTPSTPPSAASSAPVVAGVATVRHHPPPPVTVKIEPKPPEPPKTPEVKAEPPKTTPKPNVPTLQGNR